MDNVTSKNALAYAMRHYENLQCLSMAEFIEDYKRFKYIKRLCRRYLTTQQISERLMLNHIILLTNVFGIEAAVRLLFVKCDDANSYKVLKPFLLYLNALPSYVTGVNGKNINTEKISTDDKLWQRLQGL